MEQDVIYVDNCFGDLHWQLWLDALLDTEIMEVDGYLDQVMEMQPTPVPSIDNKTHQDIDVDTVFEYPEEDGMSKLLWCQGKVKGWS